MVPLTSACCSLGEPRGSGCNMPGTDAPVRRRPALYSQPGAIVRAPLSQGDPQPHTPPQAVPTGLNAIPTHTKPKPLSVKRGILGALKRRPTAGRMVVLDPGSGRTEEPVSGCEPVALAIGVAPTCPPGSAMSLARIDDELTVDGVRDVAL